MCVGPGGVGLACPEATQAIIRYASKRRNARPTSAHTVTGGVRRSKVGSAPGPPVPDAGIVLVATETTPFFCAPLSLQSETLLQNVTSLRSVSRCSRALFEGELGRTMTTPDP